MEFINEEGPGSKQTGKLRIIELHAKKGAIFCDISNELREDGQGAYSGSFRHRNPIHSAT